MFLDEIISRLEDQGVGEFGVSLFAAAKFSVPKGDGPYLALRETGGLAPQRTQNAVTLPAYQQPTLSLTVIAANPRVSLVRARAVYAALVGVRNTALGAGTSTVTLARVGATVTATAAANHGFWTGQVPVLAGATPTAYNGSFEITRTGLLTFTFQVAGSPTTPPTGTITATGTGTFYREIDALQEPYDLGLDDLERQMYVFNIRAKKQYS